ncbi:MAG: AMP-binding protein [Fimbriimonadaceae bacterium]|nr:AMP-binding protein [Alphaproteobacteria bacterium]
MLEGCTPWPAPFARRYREEGYWAGITLIEMIEQSCRKWPDKTAIVYGTERITYSGLWQRSAMLANGLESLGLAPKERVVVQLPNAAEFVVVFLALQMIGAIPVLAMCQHRRTELEYFVEKTEAAALIVPDIERDFDHRQLAKGLQQKCPTLRHVIVKGAPLAGQVSLESLFSQITEESERNRRTDPEEVALFLLSGGSTGVPKIIPRTHNDYVYNCRQSAAMCGFDEETRFLALLPLAHNYNLGSPGILGTMAYGGTVIISIGHDAKSAFEAIEREKITFIAAAVPLIVNWLKSTEIANHDLESLEAIMNGGAKLATHLRHQVEDQFNCRILESFGTTEGLLLQTRLDDEHARRYQSSGKPISPADEIRVVDDNGNLCGDDEVGELQCRGPYTIRGYYKADDINHQAFTQDGFYRMGDSVKIIDGYVYAVGRYKDLVNRGGEKISCEEVENHLHAMAQIHGVCVVAMPDEVYGEKACAFVTLEPGATLSFEDMKTFLLERDIAKFKIPERLEIVSEFPLSPAGKILRSEMRARIAKLLEGNSTPSDC